MSLPTPRGAGTTKATRSRTGGARHTSQGCQDRPVHTNYDGGPSSSRILKMNSTMKHLHVAR